MGKFVTVHGLTTMRLACHSSKLMSGKIQTVFNSKARYRWCIKCARDVSKEYTNKIQRMPAFNLYTGVVINLGQGNEEKNKECVKEKAQLLVLRLSIYAISEFFSRELHLEKANLCN